MNELMEWPDDWPRRAIQMIEDLQDERDALQEERDVLQARLRAVEEGEAAYKHVVDIRNRALDLLELKLEQAEARERALRAEILTAVPKCSTDATDFQAAKLEAAGWRLLARDVWAVLLDFRSQVLRYTVPPDPNYIRALNRIDKLIADHDAALTPTPPQEGKDA